MSTQIITPDDLREFKIELINEIRQILNAHNPQSAKKWLKSSEVRKLLQISPGTLQNLRVNGTLSFTKIGGIIFYSYDEIEQIINNRQINNQRQFQFHTGY